MTFFTGLLCGVLAGMLIAAWLHGAIIRPIDRGSARLGDWE